MGRPCHNIISVKTHGIFDFENGKPYARKEAVKEVKRVLASILKERELEQAFKNSVSGCLFSQKGGVVVIAGIFNYVGWETIQEIAQEISKEFIETVWFSMDDESNYSCGVFRDGEALDKT